MTDDTSSFEISPSPPPVGSEEFLSNGWDSARNAGIPPLNVSTLDESVELRREFISGARLLGLVGRKHELQPQQYLIADVCNAPNSVVGILLPRRSSKTTTILAIALGRCAEREDYMVAFTLCTTGQKARDRFKKDIVPILNRVWPDEKARPFKIYKGGGSERIVFDNGSIFQILPPIGDNFVSEAFDLVILDEAGKATVAMSEDLIQAILPTFDTRPGAQLFIPGTAAKFRDGNLLWDTLEDGRNGRKKTGIVEFAAPDSTSEDDLRDWETVRSLVLAAHPGIGTLTTLEIVEERHAAMKPEQFAEEYLSIFGTAAATTGIVNMDQWNAHALSGDLPTPPKNFALVIAVHPSQTSACIVAVWREDGRAKLLELEHWQGRIDKLVPRAAELSRKYRTPIVHDTQGPVTVAAEALARIRPPVKLDPQSFPNIKTAAALLIKEIDNGNVDHFDQEKMTEAAKLTKKRGVGPSSWALGRSDDEHDIIDMEAAAMGLRVFDGMKERRPVRLITSAAAA